VPITDNGAYAVTVTATDNAGIPLTDNTTFTLNISLQILWDALPTSKTMSEGGDNTFVFHATDPLHPGQETHIFLGKPAFCVDNATTGALRCQPGYTDNGVYAMTLRARAVDGVTYALPDNVAITLTVNNVNRSPVLTPTPAGALSGNVGATFSKSYVASDPDSDPLTWTTLNKPAFCQLTPSTGNTRTFSCLPTVANEGTFDNVVVRVSDGTAQAEESFSVTVANRAPSISAIADREIVYTATSATTVPVTVSDPDGNGVTASATISPTPSGGWFSFSGNVITIAAGIPRTDAGMYTVTVSAIDNGTPARSAADVTFKLGVSYPRYFGVPVAQAASMSLGVSALTLSGAPVSLYDEVAAFSVHRVPGSLPTKWESKLVGWGRVDNTAGVLPAMAVYGDDPSTASAREGMANGEEILLVLWHNDPAGTGREYYAFDDGAGAPVSVTWDNAVASKSLDAVNFLPGNRYPLRNGAWNLFGHGIGTGYHTGAAPSNSQLPGVAWNAVANIADAFPLKSIDGKIDRIISNDGSGNKVFLPGVGGTMRYVAPGYGYYIRMKPSSTELSWITVPGSPVSASASLAAGQGYSLLGVWDESHVYSQNGYDPTGELRSLRAFVDTGVGFDTTLSSIGQVWPSGTSYDRIFMYDATGARFYVRSLPMQFNTLRYVAPGYGFWINVTNPSGMTVNFPPARE
ncbi:MAG: thrombospondin type 3 repeat family protein, partial [Deltaproteobacteria bacterium]|nr:thrombospondin type 3 repeat family protein [Deltaproteobacteria bacterium]